MKIAIIYDAVYPYIVGGGEKRNWEAARRLAAQGHDVSVLGFKYWKKEKTIQKEGVKLVGLCPPVALYGRKGKRSFFEPLYFGFFVFWHLFFNRYEIIDCGNFPYLSVIAANLAKALRPSQGEIAVTWHEAWGKEYWKSYAGFFWPAGLFFEKLTAKLARNSIANSSFTKDRLNKFLKVPEKQIEVIPNGINIKELKKIRSLKKKNQIIFVGRLLSYKRVDRLLSFLGEATKNSKAALNSLILKIVGEGPEKNNLRELAKNLGISDRVSFTGFLESEEMFAELQGSKFLAIPSEREGFGIIALEAMALGTLVLAAEAECSALKSIIEDKKTGILFKNQEEFAAAVNKLLGSDDLYNEIAENGVKYASSYDWDEKIMPKITKYYEGLLNHL